MDLIKEVLKEHSKSQTLKIVNYIGSGQERFKILINNYLNGPYRTTQRTSSIVSRCVERHPQLIKPYLKRILDFIDIQPVDVAVKRNTMRLLQFVDIPEKYKPKVVELGFKLLLSKNEPVAVKVFSMTVLSHVVNAEPDVKRELRIVIEDQLPFSSAAFKSRAKKVLKDLE